MLYILEGAEMIVFDCDTVEGRDFVNKMMPKLMSMLENTELNPQHGNKCDGLPPAVHVLDAKWDVKNDKIDFVTRTGHVQVEEQVQAKGVPNTIEEDLWNTIVETLPVLETYPGDKKKVEVTTRTGHTIPTDDCVTKVLVQVEEQVKEQVKDILDKNKFVFQCNPDRIEMCEISAVPHKNKFAPYAVPLVCTELQRNYF